MTLPGINTLEHCATPYKRLPFYIRCKNRPYPPSIASSLFITRLGPIRELCPLPLKQIKISTHLSYTSSMMTLTRISKKPSLSSRNPYGPLPRSRSSCPLQTDHDMGFNSWLLLRTMPTQRRKTEISVSRVTSNGSVFVGTEMRECS